MAVAVIILITIAALVFTWWFLVYLKFRKQLRKFPGPPLVPLLGNLHQFASGKDLLPTITKFRNQYGGVFKILFANMPRLVLAEPKSLEFLLGSTKILEKSYEYNHLHSWLGTGLLTSSSAKWRKSRKLITPAFHFQILEQFVGIFDAQSDILVKKLEKELGSYGFDIFPYINLFALDIICEAAMGTHVDAQNNAESDYVYSVKEMCRIVLDRLFSIIKMFDAPYVFTKDYQIEKKALSILHGYTNSVIRKRREDLLNRDQSPNATEDGLGIKKKLAFLDLLLQCSVDGEPLPHETIREEVDTIMFEGHDTTTSGISFTLYCLAQYSEIQEKVLEELRSIFAGDKSRSPTHQDLQDMKYMELVIKESMRIYPPVPLYGRVLHEDAEYDGTILPKGLSFAIAVYHVHHNADVFPDPERFDPERFTQENSVGRSPYAYIPFSAGPRNCIGQRFAMLEMKSTVSKILRNYELLPVPGHKPKLVGDVILKSDNGLQIRLKKRAF